ncbi:hypothetical protein PUNSTDRAFT_136009 [Punctularia strigosozonata HHB-11173 SS5]|uniref:uncharacterized protein n=1 Tax=Punctularia strigosozonata (strain HHB-11173) TaxID=741275 RepID=UPI0004417070|nr:uncharacterized protein PUNSTDRAFT_136009 [Punctularia strigosozonata HHB-11173 SS5]EIN07324.1 hypothetical protein PUNSTDRAFT_136009 [Punctularia strigosozonata HHB-11173 SS5]
MPVSDLRGTQPTASAMSSATPIYTTQMTASEMQRPPSENSSSKRRHADMVQRNAAPVSATTTATATADSVRPSGEGVREGKPQRRPREQESTTQTTHPADEGVAPPIKDDPNQSETHTLRDQLAKAEEKLRQSDHALETSQKNAARFQRTAEDAHRDLTAASKRNAELEYAYEQLNRALDRTKQDLQVARGEVDHARRKQQALEAELSQKESLLRSRTAELRSAEAFLTTAAPVSEDEVVQQVKDLNAAVHAAANSMVESWRYEHRPLDQSSHPIAERVASHLGADMVHKLINLDHSQDPTVVQLALQAILFDMLDFLSRVWRAGAEDQYDHICGQIHRGLYRTQPQALSGRWRSLTHEHIRQARSEQDTAKILDVASEGAWTKMTDVLEISGAIHRPESHRLAIGKIRSLADLAMDLGTVFSERMIACDFTLVNPKPAESFAPTHMDASGASEGAILCTNTLGLIKTINVGKLGEKITRKHVQAYQFLKPQVVLVSQV